MHCYFIFSLSVDMFSVAMYKELTFKITNCTHYHLMIVKSFN